MNPLPSDVFARRLREERKRLGISQADLATTMSELLEYNVEPTAITRIEQQTRAIRLDEAVAAAMALELPLIALLSNPPHTSATDELNEALAAHQEATARWSHEIHEVQRLAVIVEQLADQQRQLEQVARNAQQPPTPGGSGTFTPKLA